MKRFLKMAGAVLLAALLAFVAINLFDEEPLPETARYGQPRAATVPEAQNGYLALLAMHAPDGTDGRAYASAWLAEVRAAAKEGRPAKLAPREQPKRARLCDPRERSCLARVRDDAARTGEALATYREDLARYETLLGFTAFEEILDYPVSADYELPPYSGAVRGQRAYLVRAAAGLAGGGTDAAIAELERDAAWQRRLLAGSQTLVGKMVGTAGYWRDLAFIAGAVQERPRDLQPLLGRLRAVLGPIDDVARDLPRVLELEFAFAAASLAKLGPDGDDAWSRIAWYLQGMPLVYKRNATVNHAYRYFTALGKSVFAAPAHQVKAEWDTFEREWHYTPWWRYARNPVGRILQSIAMPEWAEYPLAVHDLVAFSRLVALRVELAAAGVERGQAAAFIAASDPRLHDPYTREPMRWDAERGRLYFEARSRRVRNLGEGVDGGRVFLVL